MRRHETDWLALSLGGLYLVVAAVHIGDGDGAGGVDGLRWFIPGVLLVLGVLGIIGAVRGGRTPAAVAAGPFPSAPSTSAPAPTPDAPSADLPTVRLDEEPTVRLDREADPERAVAPETDEVAEADGPTPTDEADEADEGDEGERPRH